MRVLLRLLLIVICFITTTLTAVEAVDFGVMPKMSDIDNSLFTVLDGRESYFFVNSNNDYEISVQRKEANNDFNDDRNKASDFINYWNIKSFAESPHIDFDENYKISSYLKNVICIRAP